MKKVLRVVRDKDGGEELVFTPNSRMILFATMRGTYPAESDTAICDRCKIDPQLPGRWKNRYGTHYVEWLEEAIDMMVDDDAKVLERVGMFHAAQGSYQFWKDMARTKGVIRDAEPQKGLTITTDFSAIILAGSSVDEMKAQLMEKLRGVKTSLPKKTEPVTIEVQPVKREPMAEVVPLDTLEF